MPGKVKVKVIAGRNLPVMDRSSDTTDAYVEVKLGNTTFKTDVCRKSLNPQWNSEWYRFEVDDSELQDEPLQIRLMDHDTYTANDFIGKVYLDLNPLLLPAASRTNDCGNITTGGSMMSGWIPVYDTMHGIRGEVNIMVKLELFSDFNKFRQSSCGVQFFCSTVIPQGYHAQVIHGFVEELVVSDDPEYQWIDKIRTPRASNEARQTLFFKISGEIQRKIGLKALDLGGNSVIGYSQNFDLEGESGIVARGIGTAVTLVKTPTAPSSTDCPPLDVAKEQLIENPIMKPTRIGSRFFGLGQLSANRLTQKFVLVPRVLRSWSADRGRCWYTGRMLRGRSTHSLKIPERKRGSKIIRLISRRFRVKADEELASVKEISISSSSSSSSEASSSTSSISSLSIISLPSSSSNSLCWPNSTNAPATDTATVVVNTECSISITPPTPSCPILHKSQSVNALVHECVPACSTLADDELDPGTDNSDTMTRLLPSLAPTALVPPPVVVVVPRSAALPIHRRSSDSDLSITPKGGSLTGSERSCGPKMAPNLPRPAINPDTVDMLEYPFLTMSRYPNGFLQHLGGTVSARSVKLLERITNLEEPETRDAWWTELRMEVRSHARALGCNVVVGYTETTSICDDVCVLSASGTAAFINMSAMQDDVFMGANNNTNDSETEPSCSLCHIPYEEKSVPFRVSMHRCAVCKRGAVPDVLFTTIDLVDVVPTNGIGCFIHAYVARPKRDCKGEMNAKEISDGLPFLEYDIHRLLMSKLKVKGMNAIQGLKVQISIGEKLLIGLATGTAAHLTALPSPPVPKLSAGNSWKDRKKLADMQKMLIDSYHKNHDFYQLDVTNNTTEGDDSTDEDVDHPLPELDLGLGNKDACILEVDDAEDVDVVSLLTDPRPPEGFHVVCTEGVPGLVDLDVVRNLQMFTHVWRAKTPYGQPLSAYNNHINRLLQGLIFKLRNTRPASLSGLQVKVQLEQDEVQLSAVGMAVGLGQRRNPSNEYDSGGEDPATLLKPRKHMPPRSRYGVDITPLSYVPGGNIERYLGNLNFFFIRESTGVRENGGLSGFVHNFITEILAIVRAHVTALGGNAMVAYFMSECFLYNYPHKNQGQCLINVGGDAVYVSYFPSSVTTDVKST